MGGMVNVIVVSLIVARRGCALCCGNARYGTQALWVAGWAGNGETRRACVGEHTGGNGLVIRAFSGSRERAWRYGRRATSQCVGTGSCGLVRGVRRQLLQIQ